MEVAQIELKSKLNHSRLEKKNGILDFTTLTLVRIKAGVISGF